MSMIARVLGVRGAATAQVVNTKRAWTKQSAYVIKDCAKEAIVVPVERGSKIVFQSNSRLSQFEMRAFSWRLGIDPTGKRFEHVKEVYKVKGIGFQQERMWMS